MLCGKFGDFAGFDAIKMRVLKKAAITANLQRKFSISSAVFPTPLFPTLWAKVGRYLIDLYNKA